MWSWVQRERLEKRADSAGISLNDEHDDLQVNEGQNNPMIQSLQC